SAWFGTTRSQVQILSPRFEHRGRSSGRRGDSLRPSTPAYVLLLCFAKPQDWTTLRRIAPLGLDQSLRRLILAAQKNEINRADSTGNTGRADTNIGRARCGTAGCRPLLGTKRTRGHGDNFSGAARPERAGALSA